MTPSHVPQRLLARLHRAAVVFLGAPKKAGFVKSVTAKRSRRRRFGAVRCVFAASNADLPAAQVRECTVFERPALVADGAVPSRPLRCPDASLASIAMKSFFSAIEFVALKAARLGESSRARTALFPDPLRELAAAAYQSLDFR